MGYPSGQREQTVNLPASRLRRFESFPHHRREFRRPELGGRRCGVPAGVAQLVERKPSKLDVAGSSPVSRSGRRTINHLARVAQLVEHTLGKGEVIGSIPIASSDAGQFSGD